MVEVEHKAELNSQRRDYETKVKATEERVKEVEELRRGAVQKALNGSTVRERRRLLKQTC